MLIVDSPPILISGPVGAPLFHRMVFAISAKAPLPNHIQPPDRVRIHGLRNGLMIYSRPTSGGRYGHWFIVAPPLIVNEDDCGEILRRLEATLTDFSEELPA